MLSITRIHAVAVATACLASFSACADGQETQTDTSRQSPRQTSSPTAPASPTDATATPTTSPTQQGLPEGWTTCSNEVHGYTIGHPAEWHTDSTQRSNACRWFDPDEFDLEPGTEAPPTAISVNPTKRPYEKAREQLRDSENHELESFERVTIRDLEAVRFGRVQTEQLLFPAGTRSYGYVFNNDGRALYLETRKLPDSDTDYEANKQILDQAARTVDLGGGG